jgi:CTP:molybdopterin cytidylyltransferase MocA
MAHDSRTRYGLLLAADAGDGFARSRWLEPWDGVALIEHLVADAARWPVDELVVVLGAAADEVVATCSLGDATVVIDPEWEEGVAASLRVGLDVLSRQRAEGPVVVSEGAVAAVSVDDVAVVVAGHDPHRRPVTVARYRYALGPPYVVEPELWPSLMGREGDLPLATLWQAHPDWIAEVRIDRIPPRRIRTPLDLQELRAAR